MLTSSHLSCRLRRYIMLATPGSTKVCQLQPETGPVVRFTTTWSGVGGTGTLHHEAPQARGQRLIIKNGAAFHSTNLWLSWEASPPTAPSGSLNNKNVFGSSQSGFRGSEVCGNRQDHTQVEKNNAKDHSVQPSFMGRQRHT